VSREWKRGDVIMTRYGRVFFYFDRAKLHYIFDDGSGSEVEKDTAFAEGRPLVVIDPENAESCDELAELIWPHYSDEEYAEIVQAALRSLVKPPKPEEPLGLGAVVEDAEGNAWVRTHATGYPWHCALDRTDMNSTAVRRYARIDVVRILANGWQGEPDA
jgi:hypothetical protein